MPPVPDLPEPLGLAAAALAVYRFCVIPAVRATLGMLRDVREYRAGR
jgi:hypothetical protein